MFYTVLGVVHLRDTYASHNGFSYAYGNMNYRNKKLLEAVREFPCQICGAQDGTVCAAHSNQIRDGKGTGIKAHDYRIAALCRECHFDIDSGKDFTKQERLEKWEQAHRDTIGLLFKVGKVVVATLACIMVAGCVPRDLQDVHGHVQETRQYEYARRASYNVMPEGGKGNCTDFAATKQDILGKGIIHTCVVVANQKIEKHAFLVVDGWALDNRHTDVKRVE